MPGAGRVPEVPFFDLGAAVRTRRARLTAAFDTVLDSGQYIGGPQVTRFEDEFADYLGAKECVGVGNGLDALRIGMEALGIGPGDEVIVPGFTFYASWLAVLQLGARPVAVDVLAESGGIDPSAVDAATTDRTRAIMVVHLFGVPSDLATLRGIADATDVALVEDVAQAHGARVRGAMTGTVGDIAAYSFYPTKNLGALGDAGAVVTNSSAVADTVRRRRSYGQGRTKYEHVDTGWNSRLDPLQAAFLSEALPGLDGNNARRREIARSYLAALGERSQSVVGAHQLEESVWHHFVVRARDRDSLRSYLSERGVGNDVHYPYYFGDLEPLAAFEPSTPLPAAAQLSREVVSLPIAPWLTDDDVTRVATVLESLPAGLLAS